MTSITDILAMEPRYAGSSWERKAFSFDCEPNQALNNIHNDAEANAAKAILGKKLAKCLDAICLTMDGGNGYAPVNTVLENLGRLMLEARAILEEWNKLEGVK